MARCSSRGLESRREQQSFAMKMGLLAMAAFVALVAALAAPAPALAETGIAAGSLSAQEDSGTTTLGVQVKYDQTEARSMFDTVNKFRSGEITDGGQSAVWAYASDGSVDTASYQNLGALTYDYELEKVAMQRAAEIALQFSHQRPDGTMCSSLIPSGYSASGENIACGYGQGNNTTAQTTFESWSETNYSYSGQGHRRNMLGSQFNRIGIGHVVVHWEGELTEGTRPYSYSADIHYWVQEFGYRTDSFGLTATKAQNDSSAHPVDVAVKNSSIERAVVTPKTTSHSVEYGKTTAIGDASFGVRLLDASDNETWPGKFSLSWGDGATSVGTFTVPISTTFSMQSADPTVASISNGTIKGESVGSTTITISADIALRAVTAVPVRVTPKSLTSIILSKASFTYTGKAQKPGVKSVKAGAMTLTAADYAVAYSNAKSTAAGKYTVTVTGKGNFAGKKQVSYTIAQAANKVTVAKTTVKKTLKAKALKKKATKIALPKATAKFGKVKWTVAAKDKKRVLSLSGGKVKVKKGAKRGTYTIKLKASVAKTKNYKAAAKTITVKVKVK